MQLDRRLAAAAICAATYLVAAIGAVPALRLDRAGAALLGAALMVGTAWWQWHPPWEAISQLPVRANLIVVQRARAGGVAIGFWDYFRVGAPLTVLNIIAGAIWSSR